MKKIIIYSIMILILCSIVVATSGTKLLMHMDGDISGSLIDDDITFGTLENPGKSCLHILRSGDSTGDGVYYIDPDGSGAFQTYCDMTTDGGGWTLVMSMDTRSANGIGPSVSQIKDSSTTYGSYSSTTYKNPGFWSIEGYSRIDVGRTDGSNMRTGYVDTNDKTWYDVMGSLSKTYFGDGYTVYLGYWGTTGSHINIGSNFGYGIDILSTFWGDNGKTGWNSATMSRCCVLYTFNDVRNCGSSEDNWLRFFVREEGRNIEVYGNPVLNSSMPANDSDVFGGSMYFDGSDYLSIPDSDDFYFGTDDFTIDFWTYISANNYYGFFGHGETVGAYHINTVEYDYSNNRLRWLIRNAGSNLIDFYTSGVSVTPGNWYHIAAVKDGYDYTLYINGVQAGNQYSTVPLSNIPYPLHVGRRTAQYTENLNGYIDEFRVRKSVAENFSITGVPTSPREVDENTTLLLHLDGDESPSNQSILFTGGANMSSLVSKFDGSYHFDGVGDYLSIPDSDDWDFGSGDFTIDGWFNADTVGYWLLSHGVYDGGWSDFGWGVKINGDKLYFTTSSTGSDPDVIMVGDTSVSTNTWHHFSVVRDGSIVSLYLDGQLDNYTILSPSYSIHDSDEPVIIGRLNNYDYYAGYLDELRITKGFARWTSNFTPSVLPYGQPVVATTFSNESTNLSSVQDTSYVENLKLAKTGVNVQWNGIVSLDGADLDLHVKMGPDFVSIDSSNLDPSMNSSANVTLTVLHCNEVAIYYAPDFYDNAADIQTNGQLCTASSEPACTNIQCTDGVVTFEVEHFDSYTGSSGAPVPEFSDYALILAISMTLVGLFILRKRS